MTGLMECAIDKRATAVRLHGDIADNRPLSELVANEMRMLDRALGQTGISDIALERGNHDRKEHFSDSQLQEWLGDGVDVDDFLIRQENILPFVGMHGHVLDTRKSIKRILKRAPEDPNSLLLLQDDDLSAPHQMQGLYRIADIFHHACNAIGFDGDTWWEAIERRQRGFRSACVDILRSVAENGKKKKKHILSGLADTIEDRSLVTAALIASALGKSMILMGHRHDPEVRKISLHEIGMDLDYTVLVGDCGSFVSGKERPTAILTQGAGHMILLEHKRKQGVRVRDEAHLTEGENVNNLAILNARAGLVAKLTAASGVAESTLVA